MKRTLNQFLLMAALLMQSACAAQMAQLPCGPDTCAGQNRWQESIDQIAAKNFPGEEFEGVVYKDRLSNAWTTFDHRVHITEDLLHGLSRVGETYLLSVAAHEMAHIEADHFLKKATQTYVQWFKSLFDHDKYKNSARQVPGAMDPEIAAMSREHEFEADRLAVRYLHKLGLGQAEYVDFLKWMQAHLNDAPETESASHPSFAERIARIGAMTESPQIKEKEGA
ncbi:M48 family metalloprotease [Nitrospina watsonii]|uniref:Peptidase_M48 domain-containing protein n=1 Tax=Nitrospina watsonii TaxID=1323948 RepID=A0ABM9HC60_9BACT|nr:M48 family metalloprotease [Nitrospina watsonii]CAI2717659.1 Peptidase_M48 domain-containing protein [Nitrospina watsonii]